jgi:hypothetical protein
LGHAIADKEPKKLKVRRKQLAQESPWSGIPPEKAAGGPSGPIAEDRQRNLGSILKHFVRRTEIDQVIAHLECADALRATHPEWIKRLTLTGQVKLKPAKAEEFFAENIAAKKKLQRVRDGITAMNQVFGALPLESRRSIAIEVFQAAEQAGNTADVALQALLEQLLGGIKKTISALSESTPASDSKLLVIAKIAYVGAVFHRYGIKIAQNERSPFILVCNEFGMSRSTVRRHLDEIRPHLDQLVIDAGLGD